MSGAESKERSLRTSSPQEAAAKRARELSAVSEFRVWYRHSGEEEIDKIPSNPELKVVTDYNEITTSIGSHHITHVYIEPGEVMPPIHVISPHLTHLRIDDVSEKHNLSCLETLSKLEVLHILGSYSNPPTLDTLAAISQLSTLRELELYEFRLADLSQSWKSLFKLEVLHVEGRYPLTLDTLAVISQLTALKDLHLVWCKLSDLPQSFSNLQNLVSLDVSGNDMSGQLPRVIYQLSNLRELDIMYNTDLVEIESDILKLHKLQVMECTGCESLLSPPYAVCEQGLPAIKKYFETLKREAGTQATNTQSTSLQSTQIFAEADSDLSDVEDEGYLDFSTADNIDIKLDLKPCAKQSVTSLYLNSDKVYQMADGVRGRVLIINNRLFRDNVGLRRSGADVDFANVKRLFEEMNFEISEKDLTDLTAEEMLEEIQEETTLDIHNRYSMFVIFICSHGESADRILCHDNKYVHLFTITKLLSASKFPAMKGKPKLVIVQACSGGGRDYGDSKDSNPTCVASATGNIEPDVPVDAATAVRHSASSDVTLDSADFFIMKASTESYVSLRSQTHGSHFIRLLVATFYRHSCHRDLESLFKIIQERVRRSTTAERNADGSWHGGVMPESRCYFTNYRKLYFFPNFSLRKGPG